MKLLLFDIDGTLLLSGGAGARALARAFLDLYGLEAAMTDVKWAGLTDPIIIRSIFRDKLGRHELDGELDRVVESYLQNLALDEHWQDNARVLPGVAALLAALRPRPELLLGLLTGNLERGARVKLGRFGLNGYFEFGGFASDAEDRDEIARVARARGLARTRRKLQPRDVVVIGDTPRDISCGRAIGATTVAVATGPHTVEDLRAHMPDRLLADFSDLQLSLGALLE